MFNLILLAAVVVTAPEFHWESPSGVQYVELVCNGESKGWRLASDGLLTPLQGDFPYGDYTCAFRAYDENQVYIETTEPFQFTVAPAPMPPAIQLK